MARGPPSKLSAASFSFTEIIDIAASTAPSLVMEGPREAVRLVQAFRVLFGRPASWCVFQAIVAVSVCALTIDAKSASAMGSTIAQKSNKN